MTTNNTFIGPVKSGGKYILRNRTEVKAGNTNKGHTDIFNWKGEYVCCVRTKDGLHSFDEESCYDIVSEAAEETKKPEPDYKYTLDVLETLSSLGFNFTISPKNIKLLAEKLAELE